MMAAAARWSDSPQDNEESKHTAITPSCEVRLWIRLCLEADFTVQSVFVQLWHGGFSFFSYCGAFTGISDILNTVSRLCV